MDEYEFTLNPSKMFIGYPSVVLLGQRVDCLGLTTSKEKLAAVKGIKFLETL